jgi:hypothetical protein
MNEKYLVFTLITHFFHKNARIFRIYIAHNSLFFDFEKNICIFIVYIQERGGASRPILRRGEKNILQNKCLLFASVFLATAMKEGL